MLLILIGLASWLRFAEAGPRVRLSASFSAGHDDQVLAEPERRGVVEPLAEQFGVASGRLSLKWRGVPLADRVLVVTEVSGTRYGSEGVGDDAGIRAFGSFRRPLDAHFVLTGDASWWQFRRDRLDDFNVDLGRLGGRLAWAPSAPWIVSFSARRYWVDFPDRMILPDTTRVGGDGDVTVTPVAPQAEADRQADVTLGILRRLGASAYIAGEAAYRRSESNEENVEYRGPVGTLRLGKSLTGGASVSGYVAFTHRTFDRDYLLGGSGSPVRIAKRRDSTWQFGFSLERPLTGRTRFFADGSWLDQSSTIADFAFDHARFSLGISVDLWNSPLRRTAPMGEPAVQPPLAPRETRGGVRFRFLDPEATAVSLVGDFNGWDQDRSPMVSLGDGVWQIVYPVEAGIWRYAFIVDGAWRRPPNAPRYEADGFGGENGVFEVSSHPVRETHGVTSYPDRRLKDQSPDPGAGGRN